MSHPLFGIPRRKRQVESQCKRRKLERGISAPGDGGDSSGSTIVGSVTPQGSVLPPQGSAASVDGSRSVPNALLYTSIAVPVAIATTSPATTADTTIDDEEGTVISGVQKHIDLVSDVEFIDAANIPGKSVDTIVDSLLSCLMCSDFGADLGLQCTRRHLGVVSVVMTCGCEPNVNAQGTDSTSSEW